MLYREIDNSGGEREMPIRMTSDDSQPHDKADTKTSRRDFMKRAAAFAVAGPAIVSGYPGKAEETRPAQPAQASGRPRLLYVGTYSQQSGASNGGGNGQGIYLFEMDRTTGALAERRVFPNPSNPSWIALNPSKTHLYCVEETSQYQGKTTGAVSSYSIDRSTGSLTRLNTVSSEGAGPAYLSVHPSGRYVLVANYAGGSLAVLPILANGALGAATDVHRDSGRVGSRHATDAPRGSFAISGHDAPHAHMIHADPTGKRVISTDLGLDEVLVWDFDPAKGKLAPNHPHSVRVPTGDGPRHFVFHPNTHWLYCIQEEASAVVVFDYDTSTGKLARKQVISTLPRGFAGTNFSSEIRISPDGRFVYGANRLHDTVTIFSVGHEGRLAYVGEEWTRGDYPRSITLDPAGDFLFSCNQRGDSLTTFRVNKQTGLLAFTGQYTPVGTPAALVFLT